MISLKLDHSHSGHLPCHPTRTYIEQQASINETDREQLSDCDSQDREIDQYRSIKRQDSNEFKTIQSRVGVGVGGSAGSVNDGETESIQLLPARKKKPKPLSKLTPQQIYHTDILQQAYTNSHQGIPSKIRSLIMQKQKLVQDKVYLGISEKGADLLERMYQHLDSKVTHLKDRIQENLGDMMAEIQMKFQDEIAEGGKYTIHKIIRSTRQDLITNRRRKISDPKGLTFNTSQNMTSRDSAQSYGNASQDHPSQPPSQQDFSLKSQDTKKAEEFIKKIQQEQDAQRKRRREEEERKKSLEVRSMEEKRQFEEEIKNQRRNYLKRRIQAKKQIKSKQLEIRDKMNQQYKEFLKKYKNKTPLFKQKQHLFLKQAQQDARKRQQSIFQKIKQQKRSVNLSQIRQHEKKYRKLKQQKQNQKSHQKRLRSQQKLQPAIKYFKGRYHDLLAQQQVQQKERQEKEDPKLIRSELIKKRDLYAKSVRENYIPKSDQAKQKQLKQIIQKLQWTQKLKSGKLDIKQRNQTGNEYLKRLHDLIADLRAKNKLPLISKSIDYDELQKSTRPIYKNYLQETSPHRRKYSIDYNRIVQTGADVEDVQFRVKKLEEKAKRREVYVEGANFSIDRTMQERKKIDDQYLEAVKAKMALLSKFD